MAISARLLTDGEHVVVDTRTHVKALLFPLLLLVSDASTNGQVRLHDIGERRGNRRTLTELLSGTHTTSRDDDGT